MSSSKEADLTTAVLLYAMRCLAEGDQQALRAMNFGPKELEALKDMNLSDLYRADALRVHCLKIGLDRAVFWPMLEHLQRQRETEGLQRTMIVADAPLEMMQQLFGLSSREYTRWRRLLTLAPSVGRPSEPSEEDTHKLWYAWEDRKQVRGDNPLIASDYLALQQKTDIGLRAIWLLVQRWEDYGEGLGSNQFERVGENAPG
ncbi:MAG: hypothetical protein CMK46_07300 [Porticoccus sp.]|uniref:DUF2857 domain-containing protein n=1 Tax=Porticoccus hydrocarbonoclasticus TaxID=1073414 RepID=UPI000C6741CA|nr:DUF2857 domain-containing protein [Porticoccus hydrocarbonoclasticus]MBG58079.1 hypothetical protein [Porticoccus sp.]|tara:strand:- start:12341 stop:12946 length:606 start_codon:yes stop_codon:yes gene_type:complete